MARRYPSGTHKRYDEVYELTRVNSPIINRGLREKFIEWAGRFSSRSALEQLRLELAGGKEGKYWDTKYTLQGQWMLAYIPNTEKKLVELEELFKQYQQQKINIGLPKPTTWPDDLLDKRLKCEALLDVYVDELKIIDTELKKYTDAEDEKRREKMYFNGIGISHRQNPENILVEIDNQQVSLIDGLLIITDPISRYRGMAVPDYRRMADRWRKEREENRNRLERQYREQMRENGRSDIIVPKMSGFRHDDPRLPKWPEGTTNYLEQKKAVEAKKTLMKRKNIKLKK